MQHPLMIALLAAAAATVLAGPVQYTTAPGYNACTTACGCKDDSACANVKYVRREDCNPRAQKRQRARARARAPIPAPSTAPARTRESYCGLEGGTFAAGRDACDLLLWGRTKFVPRKDNCNGQSRQPRLS